MQVYASFLTARQQCRLKVLMYDWPYPFLITAKLVREGRAIALYTHAHYYYLSARSNKVVRCLELIILSLLCVLLCAAETWMLLAANVRNA